MDLCIYGAIGVFLCLILRHKYKQIDTFFSFFWWVILLFECVALLFKCVNLTTKGIYWIFDRDIFKRELENKLKIEETKSDEYINKLENSYEHFSGTRYSTTEPTLSVEQIRSLIRKEYLDKLGDKNGWIN